MKAVVLGGTGFIGSHLADSLIKRGHAVRVFDKHPEAFRPALGGVDYRWGSFGDKWDLQGLLDGMDVVYHLISTTLPKTSNDDPGFDVSSNLLPTLALLDECRKAGVKKVVFASSGGTVYGEPATLPVAEEHPAHPLCSYGVTKLSIENYLLYYRHQFGLDCAILRPSNAYGPRQNPKAIQGVIPVFLGRLKRGEPIEIWGDGKVLRDYVYVEDLAEGICEAGLKPTPSLIYNLGSGEGVALIELVKKLEQASGLKADLKFAPGRSFDVKGIVLDVKRAAAELGWKPATALEAGLAKTWDFIKGLPA